MHDVVAHHLAVMTALADGARFALAAHPDQAATALEAVSATGRSALSDMHALLGILPDSSDDETVQTSPQPGRNPDKAKRRAIEQLRVMGYTVTLEPTG